MQALRRLRAEARGLKLDNGPQRHHQLAGGHRRELLYELRRRTRVHGGLGADVHSQR